MWSFISNLATFPFLQRFGEKGRSLHLKWAVGLMAQYFAYVTPAIPFAKPTLELAPTPPVAPSL